MVHDIFFHLSDSSLQPLSETSSWGPIGWSFTSTHLCYNQFRFLSFTIFSLAFIKDQRLLSFKLQKEVASGIQWIDCVLCRGMRSSLCIKVPQSAKPRIWKYGRKAFRLLVVMVSEALSLSLSFFPPSSLAKCPREMPSPYQSLVCSDKTVTYSFKTLFLAAGILVGHSIVLQGK